MTTLKEIEKDIASNAVAVQLAKDTLAGLERRRSELLNEKDTEKHGIQIGSIVKCRRGICRVVWIESAGWSDKPWLGVNKRNSDGNWSKQVLHVYDKWELVNE